ncbi:MAG: AbrB/MazE/SpoVT family DNA-binding domain-containing protein [Elusimicrobiota bacterium]
MRTTDVRPIGPRHQVTLPADIMRKLNLHAGDLVKFTVEDKVLIMTPAEVVEKEEILDKEDIRGIEKLLSKQIKDGQYVTVPGKEAVGYLCQRMKK